MDKPLPEDLTTNGESTSLKRFAQFGGGTSCQPRSGQAVSHGRALGQTDPAYGGDTDPRVPEVGRDSIAALEST